jgi:hypothetical protein
MTFGSLRCNRFRQRSFGKMRVHKSIHLDGHLEQPQQHRSQTQSLQLQFSATTARFGEHRVMQPDPQVPQQQGDRHVQEPHLEVLRRRPNPALVHLTITGLDPEPSSIRLLDPVDPFRPDSPIGIDPGLPTPLATLAPAIPALDADQHRRLLLLRVAQRVFAPPALLALLEDVRAAGAQRMIGWAAVTDHRHQKRRPRGLEVADDRDAVELAVQHQEADLDPGGAHLFEQFAGEVGHRQAPRRRGQRDGVAPSLVDHVGRAVAVERAGALLGLAADDEGVGRGVGAVGEEQGQVEGDDMGLAA